MSVITRLDTPWRDAYEAYASATWLLSSAFLLITATTTQYRTPYLYMAAITMAFAAYRAYQTWSIWNYKLSLIGKAFAYMPISRLLKYMKKRPNDLFLGFGFDWTPDHTQRAIEIRKFPLKNLLPPDIFIKLKGMDPAKSRVVGMPWIHGIEPKEKLLYMPLSNLAGNNVVFGTTGSGKTRMVENMIFQAVVRGEVVYIIDPKGDKDLEMAARRACEHAGRPDAFVYMHLAHPRKSVRFDFLRNWNRETEVASRISSLMDVNDSFSNFAWRSLETATEGVVYIEQRPSIQLLRKHVEGGVDQLAEKVLTKFFNENVPGWTSAVVPIIAQYKAQKNVKAGESSAELKAYIHFYKNEVDDSLKKYQVVDQVIAQAEHSREHYGKMIQNVLPLLTALTSGELGPLLSPRYDDVDDDRPIFDSSKVVAGRHVVYIGLDTLSDAIVGNAVGSLAMSDLTSYAGEVYNFHEGEKPTVQVFVDEAHEVKNIERLLDKGRGAGFIVTLLTQTFPSFVVALGSEDKARQVLGNCNNVFALRTKDRKTQEYIVETFGDTHIVSRGRSRSSGSKSEDSGIEYSGNVSETAKYEKTAMFPPELLGMLQDLHFMANISGGRLVKGRLEKLVE